MHREENPTGAIVEVAIRKAGQAAIDELIDGWSEHWTNDDRCDYLSRIVDACVSTALSAALSEQTLPVRVKGLDWQEDWGGSFDDIPEWRADTPWGRLTASVAGHRTPSGARYERHHEVPAELKATLIADVAARYEAKVLSALVNAQADADVVERWQPIETVPRDGTLVDLWHEEFGRHANCYWGLPHHECGESGAYCDSGWHDSSEGWVDSSFNQSTFEDGLATGWHHQPLPPYPPSALPRWAPPVHQPTPSTEAKMSDPAIATEFQSAIIAEIERQSTSENIQNLITKKVEEVMTESIKSAFHTWGTVGKQIEKAVTDSLQINDRLDLPRYGVMVMAALRQKLDDRVHALIADRLDAEMNEILSIAPAEMKFSALVEAIVKYASEDMSNRYGTTITCVVEQNDRFDWHEVWLDADEDVAKRDCEMRFTVSKDGTILSCHLDQKDPKKTVRMGGMWGYQKMLFGAYCCGSKIIMDDLDPSTGIGDF